MADPQKPAKPQQPSYDPTEGMSTYEKFMAGVGKSFADAGRFIGNKVGLVSDAEVAEAKRLDEALMRTTAGQVGNLVGDLAITAPVGGVATMGAKAAAKVAVAAAKGTVSAAKATQVAGAINAGASAAAKGTKVTATNVAVETAKVAVKETARAAATATAKSGIAGTAATAASLGAAGTFAVAQGGQKPKPSEDQRQILEAAGVDTDAALGEIGRQNKAELATTGAGAAAAVWLGVKTLGRLTPVGRMMNVAQKIAGFTAAAAVPMVALDKAAEVAADAEIAAGVESSTANTAAVATATVAAGAAAASPQARAAAGKLVADTATDIKGGFSGIKGSGWFKGSLKTLGGGLKFLGIGGTVVGTAMGIAEFGESVGEIKRGREALAAANRVLGDGQESEPATAQAAPDSPASASAEPAAAAPAVPATAAVAEVTPTYNERAERKPEGRRPAVVAAAAPHRVAGGTGLQIPQTPAGTLRVTQEGVDGFGLGAPEAVASAPTVHYDAFGNIIAQPESQLAASASATVSASLPAPSPSAPPEPAAVDMGSMLDARLQLESGRQPQGLLPPEAEERKVAAARPASPSSPGMA